MKSFLQYIKEVGTKSLNPVTKYLSAVVSRKTEPHKKPKLKLEGYNRAIRRKKAGIESPGFINKQLRRIDDINKSGELSAKAALMQGQIRDVK